MGFSSMRLRWNLVLAIVPALFGSLSGFAQENVPAVVQPGAPGQPTASLGPRTKAKVPPGSAKDVEFMQGMIMHHAQAVEMVALIDERTQNGPLRLLGSKIGNSQEDEMKFMRRWLEIRGMSTEHNMPAPAAAGHDHHAGRGETKPHLMPGMLSPEQMEALRKAKGAEFDRLFLMGMIQHHEGALTMVKELFDTAGAGPDAELFNFASDVDSGQRAEIRSMKTLLGEKP